MRTRKLLASALIAAGALTAVAVPLPSAAQERYYGYDRGYDRGYGYGYRHYQPSRWDRDGDGIPNRRDPTPDGPGPRWDRDNDGIPNRHDPTPDGAVRMRDSDRDGVPDRYDNYPYDPRYR